MGTRSQQAATSKEYQPSDLMGLSGLIFRLLEEIRVSEANRVYSGGIVVDPTTPSSQATGVGNTLWNINLGVAGAPVLAAVDGVMTEIAPAADIAIHTGSYLTGFAVGKACKAAVVVKKDGASFSIVTVKGAVATAGAELGPTDSVITAAVGAGKPWIKLCEDRLERTADLVVAQTHDNTARPVLGVTAGFELDL